MHRFFTGGPKQGLGSPGLNVLFQGKPRLKTKETTAENVTNFSALTLLVSGLSFMSIKICSVLFYCIISDSVLFYYFRLW